MNDRALQGLSFDLYFVMVDIVTKEIREIQPGLKCSEVKRGDKRGDYALSLTETTGRQQGDNAALSMIMTSRLKRAFTS